jgi:spore coat polysaccharide biosynthesis protein SpsF
VINAIFITVRTNSSRLPRKSLLEISGKKTIEHLIDRVKRSSFADIIVLCTTKNKEDDVLCDIALNRKINFFRGSENDKLMRWMGATEAFSVDFFVTADGDDLFCEPELIDMAFEQHSRNNSSFIEANGLICGAFTYGIETSALKKVCDIKGTDETEMMWTYFKDSGLFKIEQLENVPNVFKRPEIRMTLDYGDDFLFFKKVIENFSGYFSLRDIVNYLDKNPDVIKINQYLQERFLENQRQKTKMVLK